MLKEWIFSDEQYPVQEKNSFILHLFKRIACREIDHYMHSTYSEHIPKDNIVHNIEEKNVQLNYWIILSEVTCNCCVSSKPSGNSVQLVSSCCDSDVTKFLVFILVAR